MSAALTYGLIQGGIYAGGALAKWWAKRKALNQQKGFGGSEYERELQRRTKEGIYSPSAKSTMLGQVSRRAGQTAQLGKSRVSGYMESRGLGRSMIGQSTMKDYDTDVMNRIAETTREIELANEASKVQAKERYAMERYKDRIRKGQIESEKTVATGELVSGLAGAAGASYSAYAQSKIPQAYQAAVAKYTESGDAGRFLYDLMQEGLDKDSALEIMEQIALQSQTTKKPYTSLINRNPRRSPLQ